MEIKMIDFAFILQPTSCQPQFSVISISILFTALLYHIEIKNPAAGWYMVCMMRIRYVKVRQIFNYDPLCEWGGEQPRKYSVTCSPHEQQRPNKLRGGSNLEYTMLDAGM